MRQASPPRQRTWIALGLCLLAAAIRLPGLVDKPFWIAEVQEFAYAYRPGFFSRPEFSAGDWVGYAYHSLCHLIGLQPGPAVVRAPAFVLGSLLPGLLYFLLARKGHGRTGCLAALFLALSLPALQLSQEARLYASLSTFLTLGLLLQWLGDPRARRTWLLLGLFDALALASHPYAAFWLLVRWGAAWGSGTSWRRAMSVRHAASYLPGPLVSLVLQLYLVAMAAARFRVIHQHFTLQSYPPDFPFAAELFGHLGAGNGIPAGLFALLTFIGFYLLSLKDRAGAFLLGAFGLLGPLVTLTAIWLAQTRFGFVHIVPAAVPLYVLAALAIARAWEEARGTILYRSFIAALAVAAILRMGWLDWRYHQRATRLEMGADVAAACSSLAQTTTDGDLVITTYDKYFTVFAWYCGPALSPGVLIAADSVPKSPFVRAFNHLAADGSSGPLPMDRVQVLGTLTALKAGTTVFLLTPYFEDIEGRYSESLGWYQMGAPYGPAIGPAEPDLAGWRTNDFPLLKVLSMKVKPGMGMEELRRAVQRVQATKRSWL